VSRGRTVAVVALAALSLAACTGAEPPDDPAVPTRTASGTPTADGADALEVVATRTFPVGDVDVEVEVLPLVRSGEYVVLTLDLSAPGAAEPVHVDGGLGATATLGGVLPPGGVRLVDLRDDVIHTPAEDAEGDAVTNFRRSHHRDVVPASGTRWQLVYAAPPDDVEQVGLLLPGAAFVPDLPVVDAELLAPVLDAGDGATPSASAGSSSEDVRTPDLASVAEARMLPLESYTRELDGAVSTLQGTETVEIALGSDVLFATDSADLGPEAAAAIDAAAAHLRSRAPGTVAVVGHTDDIADDAYNQQLSERRAQAVAAALAERVDADDYPLDVSGRGESEPLVPNDSDENRAANRRVTLSLTTQVVTEQEVSTTGELPPFEDGPVGTGPEGIDLGDDAQVHVSASSAQLVEGHLVVDVEVTARQDGTTIPSMSGVWSYRPDTFRAQGAADGIVTLVGATAVYPLDYAWASTDDGSRTLWLPAATLHPGGELGAGRTRTLTVIYPELGTPDSVTIQVGPSLGANPFRLTDVPVG